MANTKLNTPVVVNEYADDYDKGLLVPNNITVYSPKADKEKDNYGIVRWSDIASDTNSKIEAHNINPDAHKEVFNTKVDKTSTHANSTGTIMNVGDTLGNVLVSVNDNSNGLDENSLVINKEGIQLRGYHTHTEQVGSAPPFHVVNDSGIDITPQEVTVKHSDGSKGRIATEKHVADIADTKVDKNVTIPDRGNTSIYSNGSDIKISATADVNTAVNKVHSDIDMNYSGLSLSSANSNNSDTDSDILLTPGFAVISSTIVRIKGQEVTAEKNGVQGIVAIMPDVEESLKTSKLYTDSRINAIKKSVGYVFDTFNNFTKWIAGTYVREDGLTTSDLNIGDDIFIVEEGTPDYWVKSKSDPMTIADFAPYESGDYKPTITWLEG